MKRFLIAILVGLAASAEAQIVLTEDTAYTTLAVNSVPLVDATDGSTIEEAIAYNETGMDLQWNFVAKATGAKTTTTVTPTTAGVYDWAHQDGGMYTIEMPASGGASANNDTEGYGWFSGKTDSCLAFVGPVYLFSSSGAHEVDVVAVEGTAASTALASASDVVDEFEAQSQADPTGFHVNVLEVAGTAQTAGNIPALITTVDTVADGIKTKTDFLPSATAGASGGLFIAGTNAPVTITGSGNALTLSSTGSNGHGLRITGNGTGEGISAVGGATGNGFDIIGGATSGNGLYVNTTDGDAFQLNAQGTATSALVLTGSATGKGIDATGDVGAEFNGTSNGLLLAGSGDAGLDIADGIDVTGGASIINSGGDALSIQSTGGNGDGIFVENNGTGYGIYVHTATSSAGGAVAFDTTDGTGDAFTLAATGRGLNVASTGVGIQVGSSGADAMSLASGGGNGDGLSITGNGSGEGIKVATGATGIGFELNGGGGDFVLTNATNTNVGTVLDGVLEDTGTTIPGVLGTPSGADLATDIGNISSLDAAGVRSAVGLASANLDTQLSTIDTTADAILVDTGTTLPATLASLDSGYVRSTTVASVTSQTQLVLTAGPDFDDALNNQVVVLTDATNNDYESMRVITDYAGSTKTITLNAAADFTVAAADGVKVYPTSPYVDSSVAAITSGTGYAKDNVDSSRVWTFPKNWKSSKSPVTIIENASFNGTLKFDLTNRINEGAGALTITSVTCDPSDGITLGTPVKTSDNKGVMVSASGFESGVTYTFTVTHSTTDSDTALVSTGDFKAE